jgi:hypothetical protein
VKLLDHIVINGGIKNEGLPEYIVRNGFLCPLQSGSRTRPRGRQAVRGQAEAAACHGIFSREQIQRIDCTGGQGTRGLYRKQQAYALLEKFAEDLGCVDAHREVGFSTRSARHGIIRFAEEQSIDLIVVATHGIANILGAAAYGVVHRAPCDVLAVRERAETAV